MTVDSVTEKLYKKDAIPNVETPEKYIPKIYWINVIVFGYFHVAGLYGLYLTFAEAKWQTIVFAIMLYMTSKFGTMAGIHRLWAHRSYKANLPLRVLLIIFATVAYEGTVYNWAHRHRVHHKYEDTEADPHNVRKGLWFSHIGWMLQSKNPLCVEKAKGIDTSDLERDKLIMFQKNYYWYLSSLFCFFLPTFIPQYFWGESLKTAWHIAVCLRCLLSLHGTWLINSAAHKYGNKPYDVKLMAVQNPYVCISTLGEGWHNYHHAFPWDYKAAELGNYGLNYNTAFIDFFAKIGWAYDLKTVPPALVRKRALKTGDGTHQPQASWGWDDKDLPSEEKEEALIINKKDH